MRLAIVGGGGGGGGGGWFGLVSQLCWFCVSFSFASLQRLNGDEHYQR